MIIRQSRPGDAEGMALVLNAVVALGGTTAHEEPKSPDRIRRDYIDGPDVLSSVVAEEDGRIIGWQSVGMWQEEPHIGSFVQPGVQAKGTGRALFAATCALLRPTGLARIIAHIRADNRPGLAYYARIGFVDVDHDPHWALKSGRVVGRVVRRFDL